MDNSNRLDFNGVSTWIHSIEEIASVFATIHHIRQLNSILCWSMIFGSTSVLWANDNTPVDFNRDIRPILSDNCFKCHGPDEGERQTEWRLDIKENAFEELPSGQRAIVPGSRDASHLYQRISSDEHEFRMPPREAGKSLTQDQIQLIARWIDEGAIWRAHWSLEQPVQASVPQVARSSWPNNPIDNFILARLAREGLSPSEEAEKEALIRRVTLDLTGLPPTLKEVDDFLADDSQGAYESVVDRLLDSSSYGEHRARFWLDAARYADTHGLHLDNRRSIWPYRDWVINAFNQNMPFDQFTIEQLAGDLLPDPTLQQRVATGFHRCNVTTSEGGAIAEEYLVRYAVDRVETTSTVWLGLTAGCAVCHDHKFDPISQKEFYQLSAYFFSLTEQAMDKNYELPPPIVKVPSTEQTRQLQEIDGQIDHSTDQLYKLTLDHRVSSYAEQSDRLNKLEKQRRTLFESIPSTLVMEDMPQRRAAHVLIRGQYDKKGEKVDPGVPSVFPPLPSDAPPNRLALARWLVDPMHPLTARVTVNRFWQQFFGTGIVKTSEDFGSQGEWPSHPQLLDWLALEFISSGWDVKRIQKLFVMSATYRQSSQVNDQLLRRDKFNRLLARGPRFRMDAEMLRDNALAVSSLLVERLGGPSVKPYQPDGVWYAVGYSGSNTVRFVQDHGDSLYRRSVYTFWKRTARPPAMQILDAPSREVCVVRRERTNTPKAALLLMNDIQHMEAAVQLAQRMMTEGGKHASERITYGFRLATARRPDSEEMAVFQEMYRDMLSEYNADPQAADRLLSIGESSKDSSLAASELAAWTMVANTILNLDETITKG